MIFEIYEDTRHYWRWRLLARNNKIIADSAESYVSEYNVTRAVISIVKKLRRATMRVRQKARVRVQSASKGNE